jgi:hypothetical protein
MMYSYLTIVKRAQTASMDAHYPGGFHIVFVTEIGHARL